MNIVLGKAREVFGRMDAALTDRGYVMVANGDESSTYRKAPQPVECGCGITTERDYVSIRAKCGTEVHMPDCPVGRIERTGLTGAAITVTMFLTPANWNDPIKAVVSEVGHQNGNVAWNAKGLLILLDAAEEVVASRS